MDKSRIFYIIYKSVININNNLTKYNLLKNTKLKLIIAKN